MQITAYILSSGCLQTIVKLLRITFYLRYSTARILQIVTRLLLQSLTIVLPRKAVFLRSYVPSLILTRPPTLLQLLRLQIRTYRPPIFSYRALQVLVNPFFTAPTAVLFFTLPLLVQLPFYCLAAELPTSVFIFLSIYIRNLYIACLKTSSWHSYCALLPL